jgi:hypothetical protein
MAVERVCTHAGIADQLPPLVGAGPFHADRQVTHVGFYNNHGEYHCFLNTVVQCLLQCRPFTGEMWHHREALFAAGGVPRELIKVIVKVALASAEADVQAQLPEQNMVIRLFGLRQELTPSDKYAFGAPMFAMWRSKQYGRSLMLLCIHSNPLTETCCLY